MAKYTKLFMAALFAAMSFTLTSCGDDDDEDGPGTGNNFGDVAFTLNGQSYYWEGNKYDISMYDPSWDWGTFSVQTDYNGDKYIFTSAVGYNHPLAERGQADDADAHIMFSFKYFDWRNAQPGQSLEFWAEMRQSDKLWFGCEISYSASYISSNGNYMWVNPNGIKGTAKFVSFKDGVLAIEFTDVTMTNVDYHWYGSVDDSRIPVTLTLNGTVPFRYED